MYVCMYVCIYIYNLNLCFFLLVACILVPELSREVRDTCRIHLHQFSLKTEGLGNSLVQKTEDKTVFFLNLISRLGGTPKGQPIGGMASKNPGGLLRTPGGFLEPQGPS